VSDTIAQIMHMRSTGWSQPKIAARLGMTKDQVRHVIDKATGKKRTQSALYPLDDVRLPLLTASGVMWCMPIKPPERKSMAEHTDICANCAMEPHCREHVAQGDYIACERPLASEVVNG